MLEPGNGNLGPRKPLSPPLKSFLTALAITLALGGFLSFVSPLPLLIATVFTATYCFASGVPSRAHHASGAVYLLVAWMLIFTPIMISAGALQTSITAHWHVSGGEAALAFVTALLSGPFVGRAAVRNARELVIAGRPVMAGVTAGTGMVGVFFLISAALVLAQLAA